MLCTRSALIAILLTSSMLANANDYQDALDISKSVEVPKDWSVTELKGEHAEAAKMAEKFQKERLDTPAHDEAFVSELANITKKETQSIFEKNFDEMPLLKEWMNIRESFGVKKTQALYIFISNSMPENLIRSYQVEAHITGANLVVRGLPKGMDMNGYIQRIAGAIMGGKMVAPVLIDPRLFDRYNIQIVPTIVYAEDDNTLLCTNQLCDQAEPGSFSSMSGSVPLYYALEQFKIHGDNVDAFLERYKGFEAIPIEEQSDTEKTPPMVAGIDLKSYLDRVTPLFDEVVNNAISEVKATNPLEAFSKTPKLFTKELKEVRK